MEHINQYFKQHGIFLPFKLESTYTLEEIEKMAKEALSSNSIIKYQT